MNDKANNDLKCKECGCDLGPLEIDTFCGRCEMCDERWCGFARAALVGLAMDVPKEYCVRAEQASEYANAMMKARRGDGL